jgi:uncharacterized membrane protein
LQPNPCTDAIDGIASADVLHGCSIDHQLSWDLGFLLLGALLLLAGTVLLRAGMADTRAPPRLTLRG